MTPEFIADQLPLGRNTILPESYDPSQLRSIPRKFDRTHDGIINSTVSPIFGEDIWNCWELSWLDINGKPLIAVAEIRIPANTNNIVESKSLKLYLGSFAMTRIKSRDCLINILARDIGTIVNGKISVKLIGPENFSKLKISEPAGKCIDNLSAGIFEFNVCSDLLSVDHYLVSETLFSNLFRTKCPVTGQPDFATVSLTYTGKRILPDSLLKYFISFRQHQEFHEHCTERMFFDILRKCKPEQLTVSTRFTRRGGIDINPYRSTQNICLPNLRDPRQ